MAPTFDGCVPDPYMVRHAACAAAELINKRLKTIKLKQALFLRREGVFLLMVASSLTNLRNGIFLICRHGTLFGSITGLFLRHPGPDPGSTA